MTVAGSLQVAGLEILGARVYDPVARGFISVDPLASPAGAGWGANVYAFVGNAPVGLVDPWGLSPMTAGDLTPVWWTPDIQPGWVGKKGNLPPCLGTPNSSNVMLWPSMK
ncbi:RHS repeat-associated core domain-containing protein, partial [Rothia nasimurium]|uniref:RHS repeat-associated core domain-containing protein n=1 Tax=Rothia nasimurium TaxID=85336 RepID=UPI003C6E916D